MTPPNPPTTKGEAFLAVVEELLKEPFSQEYAQELFDTNVRLAEQIASQSAELAELRGRVETLRMWLMSNTHVHWEPGKQCRVCFRKWLLGALEQHEPTCPARPLPTPPTETK